jgi:UDP-3-O-[3-hydroxymyristoyl] N-acetylglucosamine deacetylase/3-hydroxyacyl-[acyl-carrier-protein] dehydratase
MSVKQRTIKESVTVTGVGLHTGKEVALTFHPATENHGFRFKRIDLEGSPVIKADADLVSDTSRGTTLEFKGIKVQTVEHVLAALTGLSLDNILIELNNSEPPIMDGSAGPFVEALLTTDFVDQNAEREYFELDRVITFRNEDEKIEIMAIPSDSFKVSAMIDYETKVLGTQNAVLESIDNFKDEIASCRTFVFLHELEFLMDNNLIKGGALNNAIVFVDKIISDETHQKLAKAFNKEEVKVLNEGILNNLELKYANEPARHKLLDIIGDVTLAGMPLKAHIIAKRPGHAANTEFAKLLKKHIKSVKGKPKVPKVDFNAEPVYTIEDIMRRLPHRPPFLLVDKIMELTDTYVIGMKNVTMNEAFFVGHFPGEPVMPGVLQVEAMAQAGGVLVLDTVEDPENYITYFLKIDDVRFRQRVVPGDTLVFKCELTEPIRRGICNMKVEAFVGDRLVTEAKLMAQIVKKF